MFRLGKSLLLTLLVQAMPALASTDADTLQHNALQATVHVTFAVSDTHVRPELADNRKELATVGAMLRRVLTDSAYKLQQLTIHGYGSPDGPYAFNERLARERTDSICTYLTGDSIPARFIVTNSTPEDWEGLVRLIRQDTRWQPERRNAILDIATSDLSPDERERQLRVGYPEEFADMVDSYLPQLRRTDVRIDYLHSLYTPALRESDFTNPTSTIAVKEKVQEVVVKDTVGVDTVLVEPTVGYTPSLALRTNLLYDAVLIPNIGVELYLGHQWTIGLDWFYTWFSSNSRHRYWQGYGGYLTLRRYFGRNASLPSNRLKGHHLGLYVLGMTYDVEWGGRGYQAARFGFGGGVEYGYSLALGRRLCLDFSLGVGFQDGEYKEYDPMDDHYVWQSTRKRHWWGPTKAEVSLKWLLGKKGGNR